MSTVKGKVSMRKASSKEKRFTLVGMTALTGKPVMCIISIAHKNP